MGIAQARPHAQAVISALEALGLTMGDANGDGLIPPYGVLYDISDEHSGTLADPDGEAELVYQVTSVGRTAEQARWVRDKACQLTPATMTVANRDIVRVKPEGPTRVLRDDDVSPPLFYCTPRFRIFSNPS